MEGKESRGYGMSREWGGGGMEEVWKEEVSSFVPRCRLYLVARR